ncbi:hypothetical protein ACFL3G_09350 [Planctomycetota bacterium]
MKKFVLKIILFLVPFAVCSAVELFVLPIDFFTFRVWEAIRTEGATLTTGKFYPNMNIKKEETGRFAHHTPYEVKKTVTWVTDKYGYRKQNTDKKIEVVIIGDSFIAGDGLDQHEMLSEKLEKRLGVGVYPVATANIKAFVNMPRFCKDPPSIVVLEKLENTVHRLRKPEEKPVKQKINAVRQILCANPFIRFVDITQNRIFKAAMLNYSKARIRDWMELKKFDDSRLKTFADKPFLIDKIEFTEQQKIANMDKILSRLKMYQDYFNKRNIRFIFMPIPNKETIYHKVAGLEKQPTFLDELALAAEDIGIEVLNVKGAYDNALQEKPNTILYIPDDSHWNGTATEITADLLAERITNN